MINWWGYMNIIYNSSIWFLIIILQEMFFVLLIFRVYSGNWMGKRKEEEKEHVRFDRLDNFLWWSDRIHN